MSKPSLKSYLGSGVYADYDGFSIVLTTARWIDVPTRIMLDPAVLEGLWDYVERLKEKVKE